MFLGTVYLLHFNRPVGLARHYVGFTRDLERRLDAHRRGRGGRATRALVRTGGSFVVARTWEGEGLAHERWVKRFGPRRLCPVCHPR